MTPVIRRKCSASPSGSAWESGTLMPRVCAADRLTVQVIGRMSMKLRRPVIVTVRYWRHSGRQIERSPHDLHYWRRWDREQRSDQTARIAGVVSRRLLLEHSGGEGTSQRDQRRRHRLQPARDAASSVSGVRDVVPPRTERAESDRARTE